MAAGRPAYNRRNPAPARRSAGVYVEGSAARRLQERPAARYSSAAPARRPREDRRPVPEKQPKQISKAAKRNRERALGIGRGTVVFLAVIAIALLFGCVNYLKLQTEITAQKKTVANLEAELTQLRDDNNAYYGQVTSNVDITEIKKIAIGRLGMKYPKDEQIMTYETEGRSYVRQYQDVPSVP